MTDYLPTVEAQLTGRTRDVYGHYLHLFAGLYGHLPVDAVRASHISAAARHAQEAALQRRSSTDGRSAHEHMVTACRKLFDVALGDRLVTYNPALMVSKLKRLPTGRQPLTQSQIEDLFAAASGDETGVLRFLLETGARREGVLNLTTSHLVETRQTVWLDEKGSKRREQPVSGAMAEWLSDSDCYLYSMTRRRFDGLWVRMRREYEWAEQCRLVTHIFRHTAVTRIESVAGYAVAAKFAGHEIQGSTGTYLHPTIEDVARAFSALWGEPHPLSQSQEGGSKVSA